MNCSDDVAAAAYSSRMDPATRPSSPGNASYPLLDQSLRGISGSQKSRYLITWSSAEVSNSFSFVAFQGEVGSAASDPLISFRLLF